jgi:hypothetical protein
MSNELETLLIDLEFMVREEIHYFKTGKHDGIPMRDCIG